MAEFDFFGVAHKRIKILPFALYNSQFYTLGNGELLASSEIQKPQPYLYTWGWTWSLPRCEIDFYHHDVLGSVVMLTDKNGWVKERNQYDIWGKAYEGKFTDGFPGYGQKGNVYGFTGQRYQPELGVYAFAYRDYNPRTMRWMTEDPVKDGGNWYQYCYNNPVGYVDENGLWVNFAIGAAVGFVSSTITETIGHYQSTGNLISDVGNALAKTFTDSKSLAVIGASTAIGAATSGTSALVSQALTQSAKSAAQVAITNVAVNTVVGGLGSGANKVVQDQITGNKTTVTDVTKSVVTGAAVSFVASGIGNVISNTGRNTVVDYTRDQTRGIDRGLLTNDPKITVSDPKGAPAALGATFENLLPAIKDVADAAKGNNNNNQKKN